MTSADRRICAVVVTFNRLVLLQHLVATLAATDGLDEILVVDNASTDGTRALAERRRRSTRHTCRRVSCPTTPAERAASTTGCAGPSSAAPTSSG